VPLLKDKLTPFEAALTDQVSAESHLEQAKQDLVSRCLDFNLYDAFRLVDLAGRGYVTERELYDAFQVGARHTVDDELTEMDLPSVKPADITLFFIRYDRDQDGLLRFSEFTQAFLPKNQAQAAILEARNANPPGYPFSERTQHMYKSLWLQIFRLELTSEALRSHLSH